MKANRLLIVLSALGLPVAMIATDAVDPATNSAMVSSMPPVTSDIPSASAATPEYRLQDRAV